MPAHRGPERPTSGSTGEPFRLNELLGSEMEVTIEPVSAIPHESSGKRPILKVNRPLEDLR